MSLLFWGRPSVSNGSKSVVGTCENIQITVTETRIKDEWGERPLFQIDWSERADGRSYPSFHTSKQAASEFIRDELNAILLKRGKRISH
ncbi:hypothetical protein SAMN04488527_16214 [Aliiroseovarius crassostreae]|uniref:Uncharacterized protein n=1 Tax=Aliiroseovarius crassostreae TaxID=154981 RepID=A0A0P7IKM9_9RHOB|nr:hypothetical protein AKJ29_00175 [Aliiroseovarius crassostreae]SFU97687.1 hypothetical protein SAMN04488527_16214 [Aliiroseovarius crassostreae]